MLKLDIYLLKTNLTVFWETMNCILLPRSYSTSSKVRKSANAIRNEFLEYFKKDLGHTFIRSSSVTPVNDHTVAFVNAGMNQFKGIFLDYYDAPATKVTNSQKCIRISGKHNDLNIVGSDTYHHTFFEMLGNWSFGNYFKEEACRYAWNLLTKHYGINDKFLYVTYFGGDEKLELEPDLECKDIWLSMGLSKDKVVPFGIKENFWEMGVSGPCGPCTEIHVDHSKQLINRSIHINKGCMDLTELWNIVFIQYNRLENGIIAPLSKHHVDTGMGLERLVALLQGKMSNYDTDLFQPLFKSIQRYAKVPEYEGGFCNQQNVLDCGYRILADHSRMITVALTDGVIPEKSNKLRKTIRTAIDVSEQVFKAQGMLSELSYIVADSLGHVYPELQNNLAEAQHIIKFEEDLYRRLQHTCERQWEKLVRTRPQLKSITNWMAPGLVDGYKYLQGALSDLKSSGILTENVAFKLYDTYGLNVETITELAKIESLHFNENVLQKELENLKNRSRIGLEKSSEVSVKKCIQILEQKSVPKTNDSFKYQYLFAGNNYQFPQVESKIVALIIHDNVLLNETNLNTNLDTGLTIHDIIENYDDKSDKIEIGIVLDRTVCCSLEDGQASEEGTICIGSTSFSINNVRKINGYVIHYGMLLKSNLTKLANQLNIIDQCTVTVNPKFRLRLMQHRTVTHLLNACIRLIIQPVYNRNTLMFANNLKVQYNSFGQTLSLEQLKEIERRINNVIAANIPVVTKVLNTAQFLAEDFVTRQPGKIYPYTGIRVVEIDYSDLQSKEACSGTHVSKTGDLEHFCFLNYFSKGAANINLEATVGLSAYFAKLAAGKIQHKIMNLENKLKTGEMTYNTFKLISKEIETEIKNESGTLAYVIKEESVAKLNDLHESFRESGKKGKTNMKLSKRKKQIREVDTIKVYGANM